MKAPFFENNGRDSTWTVSLPRIKTREDMENVIMKNFYFMDEVVREWTSTKQYKGRTDNNSPTGPNEAVRLATLLL